VAGGWASRCVQFWKESISHEQNGVFKARRLNGQPTSRLPPLATHMHSSTIPLAHMASELPSTPRTVRSTRTQFFRHRSDVTVPDSCLGGALSSKGSHTDSRITGQLVEEVNTPRRKRPINVAYGFRVDCTFASGWNRRRRTLNSSTGPSAQASGSLTTVPARSPHPLRNALLGT
jgi:hypothetical protein